MAIAVMLSIGLFSGCAAETAPSSVSSSPESAVAGPAASTQAPAPTGPADVSVPAQLQFSATTLDGEQFSGESLLGAPAVLWFWAPWCPTCQREAPVVAQSAADNPGVRFIGVAGLDEPAAMQQFVDRYPVEDFTQLADVDGAVWAKFGVTRQPAFAFVDAAGNVDVVPGSMSESELAERVGALSGG